MNPNESSQIILMPAKGSKIKTTAKFLIKMFSFWSQVKQKNQVSHKNNQDYVQTDEK